MVCNVSVSDIKLEAAFVSWGIKQFVCISPVADIASSLNDTYFEFGSTSSEYYVWYNVAAAGTDPAIAGKIGIEVAILAGASIADINLASSTAIPLVALDTLAGVSSDGLSFSVEVQKVGAVLSQAVDTGLTGFDVANDKIGIGGDLGRTSEGIEVAMEATQLEVKSNQTGETLLDSIQTGIVLTCSMSLLEMNAARWALIVGQGIGDTFTPAGGTEFVGFGTSKDFKSQLASSGELVLKPVSSVDDSRNFTFWKCLPVPSSINYSGTDLQVMSIEFKAFLDNGKNQNIRLGGYGDQVQDFR